MGQILINKNIILGITGGIAAYKSPDVVRRLREQGAMVRVVMTDNAKQFITPLTLQAVSGFRVHDDLWDSEAEAAMGHIELARWADAIVIAPATADCISRLRAGGANDLLGTLCLASNAPLFLAPAMNQAMWKHPQTQDNIAALKARGVQILGPGEGSQACGDVGPGRMLEPHQIVEQVVAHFRTSGLAGQKVVITAGPTREAIDAVRFITNASSGKMGYALAAAAHDMGAEVVLISGPATLLPPANVQCLNVSSAAEMQAAVMASLSDCDIFIGVAGVTDYRAKTVGTHKIPKETMAHELSLIMNPDIVATVANHSPRPAFVVGFAAETDHLLEKAKTKLIQKKLNMIIANRLDEAGIGMGTEDNAVTVLWGDHQQVFERMSKQKLARALLQLIKKVKDS